MGVRGEEKKTEEISEGRFAVRHPKRVVTTQILAVHTESTTTEASAAPGATIEAFSFAPTPMILSVTKHGRS